MPIPITLAPGIVLPALSGVTTAPTQGSTVELLPINGNQPVNIGWQIQFATAGPTAQNTTLLGSLDGVTWLVLDTSTVNGAGGEVRTVTGKAVKYLAVKLNTVTIGTCTGITVLILVG